MPPIASPPTALLFSPSQPMHQAAGVYQAFQMDSSQLIGGQPRQYSQPGFSSGTAPSPYGLPTQHPSLGATTAAGNLNPQQNVFMQPPPVPPPGPAPAPSQVQTDLFGAGQYRLQPHFSQHVTNNQVTVDVNRNFFIFGSSFLISFRPFQNPTLMTSVASSLMSGQQPIGMKPQQQGPFSINSGLAGVKSLNTVGSNQQSQTISAMYGGQGNQNQLQNNTSGQLYLSFDPSQVLAAQQPSLASHALLNSQLITQRPNANAMQSIHTNLQQPHGSSFYSAPQPSVTQTQAASYYHPHQANASAAQLSAGHVQQSFSLQVCSFFSSLFSLLIRVLPTLKTLRES